MNIIPLIKGTSAYKVVEEDKREEKLSHAYLIVCQDGLILKQILKEVAKVIMSEGEPFKDMRIESLIDNESGADITFLPKAGASKISVEDITDLITDSYIKPYELNKKIYILNDVQTMLAVSQNKLLKTLEEPSPNVHILLGATTEYPVLQTIKSRVKRLNVPPFTDEEVVNALKDECLDSVKLKICVQNAGGQIGKAKNLYQSEQISILSGLATDVLVNMNKSSDIAKYTTKIELSKEQLELFIEILQNILGQMLKVLNGEERNNESGKYVLENSTGYNIASIIWAIESIEQLKERLYFNMNGLMAIEWLFFKILEGKHKWRK